MKHYTTWESTAWKNYIEPRKNCFGATLKTTWSYPRGDYGTETLQWANEPLLMGYYGIYMGNYRSNSQLHHLLLSGR